MAWSQRAYSYSEERADRWLHRAGIAVALAGVIVLVLLAAMRREAVVMAGS